MDRTRLLMRTAAIFLSLGICVPQLAAQNRIQFPTLSQVPSPVAQPYNAPQTTIPPVTGPLSPTNSLPPAAAGSTPWTPVPSGAAPGATLGQQIQPFDPYANAAGQGPTNAPMMFPQNNAAPGFPGGQLGNAPSGTTYVPPNIVGPGPIAPGGNWQPVVPPASTVPPPNWQSFGQQPPPPYNVPVPPSSYGQAIVPAPVFPEGLPWAQGEETLFQDTGLLYTYIYGGNSGDDLGVNDIEVFTSAVFKNFAHSANGLRVTPGFVLTLLDGPDVPGPPPGIELPAQLYSAYIDTSWQPQITPQFSGDLSVRVGVYSDFQAFDGDMLRFPSRALGVLQITPTTAFKLGVEYFDRIDVKLLPAGGILWTPNDQTRFDIYFPRPKLAQYLTTYGNTEMWWYVGAEYGGGSWTFEREPTAVDPGTEERIDINDYRVYVGIDWNNLDRFNGLFEIGYVFEREIVVEQHPTENIDPNASFMVRAGLRF